MNKLQKAMSQASAKLFQHRRAKESLHAESVRIESARLVAETAEAAEARGREIYGDAWEEGSMSGHSFKSVFTEGVGPGGSMGGMMGTVGGMGGEAMGQMAGPGDGQYSQYPQQYPPQQQPMQQQYGAMQQQQQQQQQYGGGGGGGGGVYSDSRGGYNEGAGYGSEYGGGGYDDGDTGYTPGNEHFQSTAPPAGAYEGKIASNNGYPPGGAPPRHTHGELGQGSLLERSAALQNTLAQLREEGEGDPLPPSTSSRGASIRPPQFPRHATWKDKRK